MKAFAVDLSELKARFEDDMTAAEFARGFAERYFNPAFSALPKSEIDLLVFGLLVRGGFIDLDGPIYRTARVLNITPTKAKSLIFQHQLRHVTDEETDHAVLDALGRAKYWKDGSKLCFGIESPLVRAAIAARMREQGVFSEVSLSGDILKVDPGHFGEFLVGFLPESTAKTLTKRLRKDGSLDENGLRAAIQTAATKFAKDVVNDSAKDAVKGQLGELTGALARSVGGAAVAHGAIDMLRGLLGF